MGKRITKTDTKIEISEAEYLQLEGLKALYEENNKKREMIEEAFANIINLSDDSYAYERGAYILSDNAGINYDLKKKLEEVKVKILTT